MLQDRVEFFNALFEKIMSTNSLSDKRFYINNVPEEYKDDLTYILEILDGKHKLGYRFRYGTFAVHLHDLTKNCTIREYIKPLYEPAKSNNFTDMNIVSACANCGAYAWFIEPIVNRTLKLGIGRSVLQKSEVAPMLAKKYEGKIRWQSHGYFVTEKLDGNRCIAQFVDGKWYFTSRNGKPLKVNFNMEGLPVDYVYDGEILSMKQTRGSVLLNASLQGTAYESNMFSATSGRINAKYGDKDLVYNIFDVQLDEPYYERRKLLDSFNVQSENVRILPVFFHANNVTMFRSYVDELLHNVVSRGAEGLMINLGDAPYRNKRTDDLLKYKTAYTIDMKVLDIEWGQGKYDGLVGALNCRAISNGKVIECQVGSGLSDDQRFAWAVKPDRIIGSIIEVTYFSMSQNRVTNGTEYYSLRFPRMTAIRNDKEVTSVD